MGKRDLTDMLGGGGGRTRQTYKCKADGCQVTPMGVNLSKHYKVNTDWVLLKELKACVGDAALKKIRQILTQDTSLRKVTQRRLCLTGHIMQG